MAKHRSSNNRVVSPGIFAGGSTANTAVKKHETNMSSLIFLEDEDGEAEDSDTLDDVFASLEDEETEIEEVTSYLSYLEDSDTLDYVFASLEEDETESETVTSSLAFLEDEDGEVEDYNTLDEVFASPKEDETETETVTSSLAFLEDEDGEVEDYNTLDEVFASPKEDEIESETVTSSLAFLEDENGEASKSPSLDEVLNSLDDADESAALKELLDADVKKSVGVNKQQVSSDKESGIPPLYKCSTLLTSRHKFAFIEENIMAYNGICYDLVQEDDIIRIYCEKVDPTLGGSASLTPLSNVFKFMKAARIGIPTVDNTENRRIIVMKNGVYDCEKRQFRPHSPDIYATSYINVDYVETSKTPKEFDRFLRYTFDNDPILIDLAYYVMGYFIMQSNELKSFFYLGTAANSGKSLYGNFLQSLYPRKYVSNVPIYDLNKNFGLQNLLGSAANFSLEMPGKVLNETAVSRLKNLCGGGDRIHIDVKLKAPVDYYCHAKFMYASNFSLKIKGSDPAFWERVVYLPFTKTVPEEERDLSLAKKFEKEKELIIRKAIRYACDFVDGGMQFPKHPLAEATLAEWSSNENATVDAFLQAKCKLGPEYKGEHLEKLYACYCVFCEERNAAPIGKIIFSQYLQTHYKLKYKKIYYADRDKKRENGLSNIVLLA